MRNVCPGTGTTDHLPYLELPSGWPYARIECTHCHRLVSWNKDGTLRKHTSVESPTNAYYRENRAAFEQLRREGGA